MNKIVSFIYFEKSKYNLYSSNYEMNTVLLRSYLKDENIITNQYINDGLGNITEILDDIDCFGSDLIIFYINKYNSNFTECVLREYINEYGENELIIILEEGASISSDLVNVKVIKNISLISTIQDVLNLNKKDIKSNNIINIYSKNILPLNKCDDVGLNLDKYMVDDISIADAENIISEIKYIDDNARKGLIVKLTTDNFMLYTHKDLLLKKIKSEQFKINFRTSISAKEFKIDILKKLIDSNINNLDIVVNEDDDVANIIKTVVKNKKFIKQELNLSLIFNVDNLDSVHLADEISKIINNEVLSVGNIEFIGDYSVVRQLNKHLNKEYFTGKYEAILNGIDSYFTGLYPSNILEGNTKHIKMYPNDMKKENFELLKEYSSVNNAIYFFNGDNEINTYEKAVEESKKANYISSNFVEFNKKSENKYNIKINKDNVLDVSIYEYYDFSNEILKNKEELQFLKLTSERDIDKFIEDIKIYEKTGKIRANMVDVNLIDSCRWGNLSLCNLKKLPKFSLDHKDIIPCGSCEKSIGDIDTPQFKNIRKIYVEQEKEKSDRKCEGCIVEEHCAACTMLPDFLSREKYCEIMKSDINIVRYMNIIRYLKFFKEASSTFKGNIDINDVVVITPKSNLNGISEIGDEKYLVEGITLLNISGKNILFNPYVAKIFVVNDNISLIIELFIKGISMIRAKEILVEKHEISDDSANDAIKRSLSLLSEKGCLLHQVNGFEI